MNTRRNRPLITWIALMAILVGTLAPTFSAVLATWSDYYRLEICTTPAYGAQKRLAGHTQADERTDPLGDHGMMHGDGHCPFCRLQQDLPTVANVPPAFVLVDAAVGRQVELLAPTPPPTRLAWRPHLGRAPPHLS